MNERNQAITLQGAVGSVFDTTVGNLLYRANLYTLQDVANWIAESGIRPIVAGAYESRADSKRIRNAGRVAWQQIFAALDSAGFDWKSHVERKTQKKDGVTTNRLEAVNKFIAEHPGFIYGYAHGVIEDYNIEDYYICRAISDIARDLAEERNEFDQPPDQAQTLLKFLVSLLDLPLPEGWENNE